MTQQVVEGVMRLQMKEEDHGLSTMLPLNKGRITGDSQGGLFRT